MAAKQGYWLVIIVAAAGLAVSAAAFGFLRGQTRTARAAAFERLAGQHAELLQRQVLQAVDALYSIEALYNASDAVERDEFSVFAKTVLARHPELESLSWVARVPGPERSAFEAALARIQEFGPGETLVPAEARDEYFPITYLEPETPAGERVLGFDRWSEPRRRAAMERARTTAAITATAAVPLIRLPGKPLGSLLFLPVYRQQTAVLGFVSATVVIQHMLESIGALDTAQSLTVSLAEEDGQVIASWPQDHPPARDAFAWSAQCRLADRLWELRYTPTAAFLKERPDRESWGVLALGVLVTAMLSGWLFITVRRTQEVERRVVERTAELSREIARRTTLEQQLRELSFRDALTGLHNRAYFDEELERLQGGRQFPVSILVADVNGLKRANDAQGHAVGDALIQAAAGLLRRVLRAEDIVARIGGDEFAALLPATDTTAAARVLARVREALQRQAGPGAVSLSLGTATAQPGQRLRETLQQADTQMYRDKSAQQSRPA